MAEEDAFEPLLRSIQGFFNTPRLADGVIQCGRTEFKIHKLILCAQSGFFMKAFTGEWKESDGSMILEDDDESVVEAMLRFMYKHDYDSSGRAENSPSPMVFNVKVYSIADKYDIPALKSLAKHKFGTTAVSCWDMDDFPDAIMEVYHSTLAVDQGLRDVVVDVACKHINQLLSKQRFCDVLEETVGFAAGIVQRLANQGQSGQRKYRCPNCEKEWEATLPAKGPHYYCIQCGVRRSDWASVRV